MNKETTMAIQTKDFTKLEFDFENLGTCFELFLDRLHKQHTNITASANTKTETKNLFIIAFRYFIDKEIHAKASEMETIANSWEIENECTSLAIRNYLLRGMKTKKGSLYQWCEEFLTNAVLENPNWKGFEEEAALPKECIQGLAQMILEYFSSRIKLCFEQ